MSRILGIDYGDVRIGLAITDPLKIIVKPFKTLQNNNLNQVIIDLDNIIKEKNIDTIVLGLPKNMDGTEGFQAEKTRTFAQSLQKVDVKLVFWNEQLSSKQAEEILHTMGYDLKSQRKIKDQYAACVILEDYLQYGG